MTADRRPTWIALGAGVGVGALVAFGASARPSEGASPASGSLTISPAIVDVVARPGDKVGPIVVSNTTAISFRIRVYPALVDQNLDGSLSIRPQAGQLALARLRFALSPGSLVLAPGKSATIGLVVRRFPAGRPSSYAAAVVDATPPASRVRGAGFRLRLLGGLFVRSAAAPTPRGRIEAVRVTQPGRRRLGFAVRLRNTGRVHGYPELLRVRVRDRLGRVVFTGAPRSSFVLPGYRRDFRAQLFRLLPAGRYRVEGTGRFGVTASRTVSRFTLVAPNRLAPA